MDCDGVTASDVAWTTVLCSSDMLEVPLFLSNGQASALENAAHNRGITTGQMIRRLIEEFLRCRGDQFRNDRPGVQ